MAMPKTWILVVSPQSPRGDGIAGTAPLPWFQQEYFYTLNPTLPGNGKIRSLSYCTQLLLTSIP